MPEGVRRDIKIIKRGYNVTMSNQNRSVGIMVVAVLMIVFGLAEIATGFTHNFLGLVSTVTATASTYGGVGVGALYAIGGCFLLRHENGRRLSPRYALSLSLSGVSLWLHSVGIHSILSTDIFYNSRYGARDFLCNLYRGEVEILYIMIILSWLTLVFWLILWCYWLISAFRAKKSVHGGSWWRQAFGIRLALLAIILFVIYSGHGAIFRNLLSLSRPRQLSAMFSLALSVLFFAPQASRSQSGHA